MHACMHACVYACIYVYHVFCAYFCFMDACADFVIICVPLTLCLRLHVKSLSVHLHNTIGAPSSRMISYEHLKCVNSEQSFSFQEHQPHLSIPAALHKASPGGKHWGNHEACVRRKVILFLIASTLREKTYGVSRSWVQPQIAVSMESTIGRWILG